MMMSLSTLRATKAALVASRATAAVSWLASRLLLCAFFWMVAAAGFAGFVGKWAFLDGSEALGIEVMLDGTIQKPFIYRQLVPATANFLELNTPANVKAFVIASVHPDKIFVKVKSINLQRYQFRYAVIYYLTFLSFFCSLFLFRRILLDLQLDRLAAVLAPVAMVLAFPYLQTRGGYFYDGFELMFAGAAILAAVRGQVVVLLALTLPATLNKESFFFFVITLYPLLRINLSKIHAIGVACMAVLISGLINITLKLAFAEAPGVAAQWQLFDNMRIYLQPWFYRLTEDTYGLVGPAGVSMLSIALAAVVAVRSWTHCPGHVRQHMFIALAINLPLFVAFCAAGELRNMSMLFPGFVLLIGYALDRQIRSTTHASPVTTGAPRSIHWPLAHKPPHARTRVYETS